MYINIITPCIRPENLKKISESINIPRENYRWIVVFDSENVPENIPQNCESYAIKVEGSIVGNGQRNYAINLISTGYLYFNDDDTIIHPELWENIKDITTDFISFKQANKDGNIRLEGRDISPDNIDSHNFLVKRETIGNIRWEINKYSADGVFAQKCKEVSDTVTFIPKVLSVYNTLNICEKK